jgi:quinol monooxygenase YgiN
VEHLALHYFRELTLDATEFRFVSDTSDEPKRRNAMFTRVVAVRTKPGKVREFSKTIHDRILPILEDQPGFVDEILLVSNSEPDQILALSFWKSQQDAERYTHEEYPRINELISHLVESPPVSRTFDVDIFTSHKITRGKAA